MKRNQYVMRVAIFSSLLLIGFTIAGCTAPIPKIATPVPVDSKMLSAEIHQQLDAGAVIEEIDAVDRHLPDDVVKEQLGGYFRLGSIDFALAMQPSLNVPLALPAGDTITFTGVLVSMDGKNWEKYVEIRDQDNPDSKSPDKNNPYYLWTEAGDLFLSVVDQTGGGGSGEGTMKLERLTDSGGWELVECYDFGQSYRGPSLDGDYFAFSQEIAKQKRRPTATCQNVELISNP